MTGLILGEKRSCLVISELFPRCRSSNIHAFVDELALNPYCLSRFEAMEDVSQGVVGELAKHAEAARHVTDLEVGDAVHVDETAQLVPTPVVMSYQSHM